MWSLKYNTDKLIYKSETDCCGCQGGGWGREGLRVWDQQLQTIIYRMDKHQRPIVYSTCIYIQYPMINHSGKEYEKECINESLCCTAEINITW